MRLTKWPACDDADVQTTIRGVDGCHNANYHNNRPAHRANDNVEKIANSSVLCRQSNTCISTVHTDLSRCCTAKMETRLLRETS